VLPAGSAAISAREYGPVSSGPPGVMYNRVIVKRVQVTVTVKLLTVGSPPEVVSIQT
jgi:hypothetical protein